MKYGKGDKFWWNGIEYEVLEIMMTSGGEYYKVRGSCGAIKILPCEWIDRNADSWIDREAVQKYE
jgi:hypothetical protein